MTLPDIIRLFPTDASCRELLERLRWPKGVVCVRCGGNVSTLGTRLYQCSNCPKQYQFAVTTGTIFADTHLALEKWFLAVLLLCEARKGISAKQLQRTLGVSYKTAWYLCHRIRAAMATAARPPLTGVGSWHKVSAKHLMRYLAEMEFRFNRRHRSDLFLHTLRHMVTADPLSFAELVK